MCCSPRKEDGGGTKVYVLYVGMLFALDGVARAAVLNYFGQKSNQYSYFYWLTDVALALGAFLLICGFFRRACAREEKMWTYRSPAADFRLRTGSRNLRPFPYPQLLTTLHCLHS